MFRSRLGTVLRVRERREEAAALELAAAKRDRLRQEELLAALEQERKARRGELRRLEQRGLLARELLMYQEWDVALGRRLGRERLRLKDFELVCEQRRMALLERSKEKKVLERLKERQRLAAKLEEERAAQKALDELSGRLTAGRQEAEGL